MLEVKPSATLQADSFWMAIWQSGALSIQEAERRALGSQRLKETYSSVPFLRQESGSISAILEQVLREPREFVANCSPADILLDSAAYRIRAATQFLENLAMRDGQTIDPATLQDLAQRCSIPLRDGCDVMDVIA
ncbi:hypothetical protein ACN079_27420 [Pseudomonas sp. ABY48]|uniref:hypothetical protein n=1 Tax=Pseudomonas sp. ABY48 TaxID=3402865 RepID=UPI003B43AA06